MHSPCLSVRRLLTASDAPFTRFIDLKPVSSRLQIAQVSANRCRSSDLLPTFEIRRQVAYRSPKEMSQYKIYIIKSEPVSVF